MRSGLGLLRHAHQDVRDLVFDSRVGLRLHLGEEGSISVSLTWMRSSTSRSRTRVSTICSRRSSRQAWNGHAVALQRAAKIRQAHVVVLHHALHRAVELQLVDPDALVARELQLGLVQDQPLEHLALEQAALRQRRLLPPRWRCAAATASASSVA